MKPFRLLSLLLFPLCLGAQEPLPRFVIGTEAGFDFRQFTPDISEGTGYTAGVNIERPIGRFSIGSGLLFKQYGWHGTNTFSHIREGQTADGRPWPRYVYERHRYELSYYSIPLRLQYRLPCNCLYLQAGVHADIANEGNEEHPYGDGIVTYRPPAHFRTGQDGSLKPFNYTFELALGLKMHFNPNWRLFARPAYRIVAQPVRLPSPPERDVFRQLHIAFGLQRAFF